jgi:hypothetical protein
VAGEGIRRPVSSGRQSATWRPVRVRTLSPSSTYTSGPSRPILLPDTTPPDRAPVGPSCRAWAGGAGAARSSVLRRFGAYDKWLPSHVMISVAFPSAHQCRAVQRPALLRLSPDREHRQELLREATVMVLYVSVVEIAALAALPEKHFTHGLVTGAVGDQLLGILWGTAVGLALAHWFAFGLAAPAFRGERPSHLDAQIGLAQLAGAILVAALSSVPVLLFSNVRAQETTGDVPALLVGVVGYLGPRERAGCEGVGGIHHRGVGAPQV